MPSAPNLLQPVKSASEAETDLWEEMNRREQWDRDFECRKPTIQADLHKLRQALSEEDYHRLQWDELFQNQQSTSPPQGAMNNSPVVPADASAEAGTNASANADTSWKSPRRFGKGLKNRLRILLKTESRCFTYNIVLIFQRLFAPTLAVDRCSFIHEQRLFAFLGGYGGGRDISANEL